MIFHPGIIALLVSSILISLMAVYASYYGVRILAAWDLSSGSELQICLEKKTYLISTLMSYGFGCLIVSFFFMIFTADDLHRLFVGAMCAAGTLNVNPYGYPTLLLKLANCLIAGVWLIMNHADNLAPDYPLIRRKYTFLVAFTPLLIGETVLQAVYFLSLKPNIITSCCGSLFSAGSEGLGSGLASLPMIPLGITLLIALAVTLAAGLRCSLRGPGGGTAIIFSIAGSATFLLSVAALISFISLYFYELPTHHCPFCILQKEYHYVGYLIYFTLIGGGVGCVGVGVLDRFRRIPSLKDALPAFQKELTIWSLLFYLVFTIVVVYEILASNLLLFD